MKSFREILQLSLSLASEGKLGDALTELEEGMERASNQNDHEWVVRLSTNAGWICDRIGNLNEAEKYYCLALKHNKSEPGIYFVLGELSERLDKKGFSARYFKIGYKLAIQQNDKEFLEIFERVFEKRGYKKPSI